MDTQSSWRASVPTAHYQTLFEEDDLLGAFAGQFSLSISTLALTFILLQYDLCWPLQAYHVGKLEYSPHFIGEQNIGAKSEGMY